MGDDYFGTGATPPVPAYQPVAASRDSVRASRAGAAVVLSGLLMCAGAFAPWVSASAYGASFHYSGMHSALDGRWLLGLGFVVAMLGVLLTASPQQRDARAAICAVCVVVGIVGLVIVIHQHDQLSSRLQVANDLLGSFLPVHVGTGWGMWLSGLGCIGASLAGVLAFLL